MVTLVHGPEAALAEAAVARALTAAQAADPALEVSRYDAETSETHELLSALTSLSLFAEARLVIISGLAERLEKDERLRERLAPALADPPTGLSVLLRERRDLPASHPLVAAVKAAGGTLVACAPLTPRDFPDRVRALVREVGARITEEAIRELAARCYSEQESGGRKRSGPDLLKARTELEKLKTYVGAGGRIEVDTVKALVPEPSEQVFALTDALSARNLSRSNLVLDGLLARDQPAQVVFAMIVRQFRILLLCEAGRQERGGLDFLRSGEYHLRDFQLSQAERQAQAFGAAPLRQVFGVLLRADAAIKTGKLEAEEALRLLVASICTGSDLLPALT